MDAIQSVGAVASQAVSLGKGAATGIGTGTDVTKVGTTPFADLMSDAVSSVNTLDAQAKSAVEGLMTGQGVDVHQAMIATQKADMAFELVLAVRNKAVAAYQSVMGMQF